MNEPLAKVRRYGGFALTTPTWTDVRPADTQASPPPLIQSTIWPFDETVVVLPPASSHCTHAMCSWRLLSAGSIWIAVMTTLIVDHRYP